MSWLQSLIKKLTAPATTTHPTRVVGTAFQPSTTSHCDCTYSVHLAVAHGQDLVIQVLSDSANPPTTVRAQAELALVDDTATMALTQQLHYKCPAGDYVKIVSSGTGTPTIALSTETPAQ